MIKIQHKHHNLHHELHYTAKLGWLRAGVLGANDGIISTASLILGVAAAGSSQAAVLIAALAGLLAGALSMSAGEYVSVCTQADSQRADLAREQRELERNPAAEQRELAGIYMQRGLNAQLAAEVAKAMTEHDALAAHARDELSIDQASRARPVEAALASALAFIAGGALPVLPVLLAGSKVVVAVWIVTLFGLLVLGLLAAWLGGARPLRSLLRVGFWGITAMLATSWLGQVIGYYI